MEVIMLRCPVPGCKFSTEVPKATGGHIAGHKKRGDWPKDARFIKVKVDKVKAEPTKPPEKVTTAQEGLRGPSSMEIARSLLKLSAQAIQDQEFKDQQIKALKGNITKLESELAKITEEKDRILKLHNDLVQRGNGEDLPSSEELVRMASSPKLRG